MSASFSANAGSSHSTPVPSAPHNHFWPAAAYATQPSAAGSTWIAPAPRAPSKITGTSSCASAAGATSPVIQLTCETATSVVSGPTASATCANGTTRTSAPRRRAASRRGQRDVVERRAQHPRVGGAQLVLQLEAALEVGGHATAPAGVGELLA